MFLMSEHGKQVWRSKKLREQLSAVCCVRSYLWMICALIGDSTPPSR